MAKVIRLDEKKLRKAFKKILFSLKVKPEVSFHLTQALLQTSLRGVDSHGIRLFPHYISALKGGRINGRPKYKFNHSKSSAGLLDADHTFGHAAGAEAMERAIKIASKTGLSAVSVYNSSHFGAAAYYSLIAASKNMIGISFTHADSLLLTHSAKEAYFGTNPICFAAPCNGEGPFCLDMATSVVTWNKIRQYKEKGKNLPVDIGADKKGRMTQDITEVMSLLPIGGYKGFGLSMMIDILCSLLSGMPFGQHLSSMFKAPLDEKRYLGHFFIAIDISAFGKASVFKKRLKQMMDEVRRQPKAAKKMPIMVAGDPEKKSFKERVRKGIPMDIADFKAFSKLEKEFNVSFR